MDTSPGTVLVWSLAAREAMLAEMPEIEPEHLYCALLKVSELAVEEMAGLLQRPSDPAALATEQAAVRAILEARGIDSRQARRGLRQALGKGGPPPAGGTVHRSAASRELFLRAARRAAADGGALEPRHLLAELLDRPTPPMAPFVGQAAEHDPAAPKGAKAAPAPPPDERCRPLAALAPAAGFRVPEDNAPQVRALLYLLGRPRPPHLLLWVEPGLPLIDLLGQVGEHLGDAQQLLAADLAALGPRDDGPAGLARGVAALASALRAQSGACLVFDLTALEAGAARAVVESLQATLAQPAPRLVLALPAQAAGSHRAPGPGPAAQALLPIADVHAVWLHHLSGVRGLERV